MVNSEDKPELDLNDLLADAHLPSNISNTSAKRKEKVKRRIKPPIENSPEKNSSASDDDIEDET